MIKPYYKHEHNVTIVEVEDFGVINLNELPIRVRPEKKGVYEIVWSTTLRPNGETVSVLCECGGFSSLDYAGRTLGVIREIE